ncbi:MAG: FtsX-like permease family protein, partial [Pseudomonadota bacterium]
MRGSGLVLRVLLSHWRRNPIQFAALVVGLLIATALWAGVQALNAEARASYDRAAALIGQDTFDRLEAEGGQPFSQDTWVALRRAGWKVSPVIEARVRIGEASYRLLGIEPLSLPQGPLAATLGTGADGQGFSIADFTALPGQAFAGPTTLARLASAPGERPETEDGTRLPPLVEASGLVSGTILLDIGRAQDILALPGRVSYLLIDPDAPAPDTPWAEIAPNLTLIAAGRESDIERLTDSFHLNLTAFGFLAFVVGLFIVHAAIGLAFEQRLAMIRTIRACGVSARQVTLVLLAELTGFALIAGLIGLGLGYLIAAALLPNVAGSLRGLYGADVAGFLTLRPTWVAAGLGMSLLGALVAAGHTLARAWSMPVLASAKRQAWRGAQARALRWQGAGAGALLL